MDPVWPYLTADIPSVPAGIKRRDEDFVVEEVPLYDPCGSGDHVYALIEKVGMTTRRAVLDIAQALGVPSAAIGVAGQKDARGVTRQMVSVHGADPARIRSLVLPGIRILDAARHRTKLRPGSLRANRFVVRLRETPADRIGEIDRIVEVLARRGVPNYFGPQRFGMRGDTWEVGRALLCGDFDGAVRLIVGRPTAGETGAVRRARELAAAGQFGEAARAWPVGFRDCVHLCRLLARTAGAARRAIFGLDHPVLSFYVSAYQAWLFNRVLAERVPGVDRVLPGDLVFSHLTGAVLAVEDAEIVQPCAARFEVSPTGPIVGYTMSVPRGEPAALEHRIIEEVGLSPIDLPRTGPLTCVGGRRPLRFRPEGIGCEAGSDGAGPFLELRFTLPPGCYATSLLREIGKDQLSEGQIVPNDEEA